MKNLKKIPFSYVGDWHVSTDDITRAFQKDEMLAKFSLEQLVRIRKAISYEIKHRKETI